jgi:hypothetical protein
MFYAFLLNMWKLNRLTEAQVDQAVAAGRITSEQGAIIKATERAG